MSKHQGLFVVIEGPSGVGKTTVTAMLDRQLAHRGLSVMVTKEPSDSRIGTLARQGTAEYRGLTLACLIAADRYHHLEHVVRPALRAGAVVLCDRYVPTSLVLQRMDDVAESFLWQLNQYADKPDLTIFLVGQPERSRAQAEQRGTYSRFHEGGTAAGEVEDRLYRTVAHQLSEADYDVLQHDVKEQLPEAVAGVLLEVILDRLGKRSE